MSPLGATDDEGDQRHDAALAVVVRAHDEHDVLERDHDHDRPEDERDDAVDRVRVHGHRPGDVAAEHRLDRVQGACADVAEHNAERAEP